MRSVVGVVLAISLSIPAAARQAPLPPTYAEAERSFLIYEPTNRAFIQLLMTAAGYWVSVPTPRFGPKIFEGISAAQAKMGLPATGIINREFINALDVRAKPMWQYWGIKDYQHPVRGLPIFVPAAIGITAKSTSSNTGNVIIENGSKSFSLDYNYFSNLTLDLIWDRALENSAGDEIIYKIKKPDFLVIYARRNGISKYQRYQFDSSRGYGVLGFNLWYREDDATLYGDRLTTLISGKLAASVTGSPFFNAETVTLSPPGSPPPHVAAAPKTVTPAAIPPNNPIVALPRSSSGSGYYVSANGHIVSNNHVIEGCHKITVKSAAGTGDAKIVALDKTNDLALIKVDITPPGFGIFRRSVRQGESVAAYGYPLTGYLSQNGNFTIGNVSALTGLDDDSRALQVSTPIQPGNSGGPLVDERGNIVGTIESKLNAMKMASTTNDIAQNVNFAIKSSVTAVFLESNDVNVVVAQVPSPDPVLSSADLAEKVRAFTVSIQCMRN